jgi:anti-anti-sigma regulatory factor
VTYLDSRGIRVLVQLARRLQMKGVEFFLVAPVDSIAGGVLGLVQIPELRLTES